MPTTSSPLPAWASYVRAHLGRLRYYAGRVVKGSPPSLAEVASARCLLSPAEPAPRTPPRMVDGHLERIRSGAEGEPAPQAIEQLTRRQVVHDPTTMLVLEDVALVGHRLFVGRASMDLFRGSHEGEFVERDEVVLASTHAGSRWFGHFVHDELPLQLLAETLGPPIAHERPLYPHEPDYRAVFRVRRPPSARGFVARRCLVLIDHAQNESKRARYARMRMSLSTVRGPSTRVYVRRSGGARRVLANEEQLIDRLLRNGFTVLEKGIDPVERVVDLCTRAEQIVGLDGSHMAPCVLLAPDGAEIATIVPPDRVSAVLLDVAAATGHRTATYIAEGSLEGDLFVDPDALIRHLDESRATYAPRSFG